MREGLFEVKVMLEDPDGDDEREKENGSSGRWAFYGNDSRLMKHVDQLWSRIEASRP